MIDLKELEQALLTMKPRTKFFNTVKEALKKIGRWKYLSRGRYVK